MKLNITFPQIVHENGYQTAMFGKLHFGNNPKGFDKFKILPGQEIIITLILIRIQGIPPFKDTRLISLI
jgi:hypothetical protein